MLCNSGLMKTGTFRNFSILQFEALTDFRYSLYLNSQNSITMNCKNFCAEGQEHLLLCRRLQININAIAEGRKQGNSSHMRKV